VPDRFVLSDWIDHADYPPDEDFTAVWPTRPQDEVVFEYMATLAFRRWQDALGATAAE
jgi:hypothetical protein